MKKITQISIAALLVIFIASCGNSQKDEAAGINDKKAALEKLKASRTKTDEEIQKLQSELEKLDTNAVDNSKIKLVSVAAVSTQDFKHYIDLQGSVDAENISHISPRGMPGQVKAVYVQQGQQVKNSSPARKRLADIFHHEHVVRAGKNEKSSRVFIHDGLDIGKDFRGSLYLVENQRMPIASKQLTGIVHHLFPKVGGLH